MNTRLPQVECCVCVCVANVPTKSRMNGTTSWLWFRGRWWLKASSNRRTTDSSSIDTVVMMIVLYASICGLVVYYHYFYSSNSNSHDVTIRHYDSCSSIFRSSSIRLVTAVLMPAPPLFHVVHNAIWVVIIGMDS